MGEGPRLRLSGPFDQRRRIEPGGVQRLQQVVAGGGEEAGLVAVGGVGLLAGAVEFGVDPEQSRGALLDPPLQGGIGPLQCRLGVDPLAHIREADHQPAIGQARRVEFERLSLFSKALRDRS